MAFAKLFETKERGQILVKIDTNEDCLPEVRFYFEPPGLGTCSFAVSTKSDTDEDWSNMEKFFDSIDQEAALNHVNSLINKMSEDMGL